MIWEIIKALVILYVGYHVLIVVLALLLDIYSEKW